MNSLIKKLFLVTVISLFTVVLNGCSKGNSIDDKVIVIAASPTPHAQILEQTRVYIESKGYKLEIKEFSDYVIPNNVTESGEVDANFFQHEPYLIDFNENNKTSLTSVFKVHFEPLGLYQGKRTSLENLENAKIGIANDTSNGARGLLLLAAHDIIELDPLKGVNVTVNDIISNPYNIEIVELEAAAIPANLPDLDFAVINGNYALNSKINKTKLLASEDSSSIGAITYANIVAVKEGNENKEAIKILIEALSQKNIIEFIYKTYNGVVVPSF